MKISLRKLLAVATPALAATVLLAPMAASASSPSPSAPAGHIGGLVPVHGSAKTGSLGSGSNLSYHKGPVMNTNTVYLIYWVPPSTGNVSYAVSNAYQSTVNQFFTDVAADNGKPTNVYDIDTQYYSNAGGAIAYSENFLATSNVYYDSAALPASGCNDSATPVCLTDAQIQSEIKTDITKAGWSTSPTSMFFLLTGNNIGSCSGSSCAFTQYCAYHGVSGSGSTALYYANMPYAATDLSACGSQQYPNNDAAADSEINVLSHEHNEAITDEALNAWYDRRGYEIGDKCAWNFGTTLGNNGYGNYNQVINTHDYYVQQEWSNASSACALHM